jgi:hypothetical protein
MTLKLTGVMVAAGLLSAAAAAAGHHSFSAQYDANKPITLRGVITRMLWSNPHGHLFIDVKMPDGRLVTWELETASPPSLYRRGWRKDDLPVGAEVVVRGFLARDGTANANATSITLTSTGKELFAGSAGTGAPVEPPGESGTAR